MNTDIFNFATEYKKLHPDVTWNDLAFLVNHKFGMGFSREGFRSAYRRKLKEARASVYSPQSMTDAMNMAAKALQSFGVAIAGGVASGVKPVNDPPVGMGAVFTPPLYLAAKKTLILSDLHCPFYDSTYLKYAIDQASVNGIEQIALLGDIFDFDGISQWPKDHKTFTVEYEMQSAGALLKWLSDFAPVYVCMGNHDERFTKKLDSALSFRRVISAALDGANTTYPIVTTDYDYMFIGDHVVAGHLSNYSKSPGKIAAEIATKHNRHALVGHDHIHGVDWNGSHFGISIGCMANVKAFWYKERRLQAMPDFVNGFAIVHPTGEIDLYRGTEYRTLYATQY